MHLRPVLRVGWHLAAQPYPLKAMPGSTMGPDQLVGPVVAWLQAEDDLPQALVLLRARIEGSTLMPVPMQTLRGRWKESMWTSLKRPPTSLCHPPPGRGVGISQPVHSMRGKVMVRIGERTVGNTMGLLLLLARLQGRRSAILGRL